MNSKKVIYAISALIVIMLSCNKNETDKNYGIVKGTISNPKADNILVLKNSSVIDSIPIAEDGSFIDTLDIKYPEQFTLMNGRNNWNAYIEEGGTLTMHLDIDNMKQSLTYSGTGAAINNYLVKKMDTIRTLNTDPAALKKLYLSDEGDFKTKKLQYKKIFETFLSSYKNLPGDFVEKEKRNIYYEYLKSLKIYESFHRFYSKNDGFKVSENFLTGIDTISNYNNEEDYYYSSAYRTLLEWYCTTKAEQIEDSLHVTDKDIAFLKAVNTLQSPEIKSDMAYYEIKRNFTFVKDPEAYYDLYMKMALNETQKKEITSTYKELMKLAKGAVSPVFSDYENYAGGTTSLTDLQGKYVYIDVWATWCMPCRQELPYLKQLEKEYEHKNITFVSISIDVEKSRDTWKKMIAEKNMGGLQLRAPHAGNSDFVKQYMIRGIPRFILIDPQGKIVNANAPRPSEEKEVRALFNSLSI